MHYNNNSNIIRGQSLAVSISQNCHCCSHNSPKHHPDIQLTLTMFFHRRRNATNSGSSGAQQQQAANSVNALSRKLFALNSTASTSSTSRTNAVGGRGGEASSVEATVSSDECSTSSWESGDNNNNSNNKRTVRFVAPQQYQYHDSPWLIVRTAAAAGASSAEPSAQPDDDNNNDDNESENDVLLYQHQVWYHKTDIGKFKSDAQVCARILQVKEKQQSTTTATTTSTTTSTTLRTNKWAQHLHQVFHDLHAITDLEGMNAVMDTAGQVRAPMEAEYVGLDKYWGNGSAVRSRGRKTMYAAVAELQSSHCSGSTTATPLDKALRKTCRDASRTSRLYAIYVARIVAKQ